MHAADLGNVLRIIREQTRQKDARRKPISARTAGFQPGTTETLVSEFVRTFRFAAPKTSGKKSFLSKRLFADIWSLRKQETQGGEPGLATPEVCCMTFEPRASIEPIWIRHVSRR